MGELFDNWIAFVKLGVELSTILSTNYKLKATKPTRAQLEVGESAIRACAFPMPASISHSRLIASHYYQFKLCFE